jgi:hypothetical protein
MMIVLLELLLLELSTDLVLWKERNILETDPVSKMLHFL